MTQENPLVITMRQYLIDEISISDIHKVRDYLKVYTEPSSIEDLYWLILEPDLLAGIQLEHLACQPYGVAIELGVHSIKVEFLIRSRVHHNCSCYRYADAAQRDFIMAFADRLIHTLGIRT